jgi:CRISPR system Cascade subunit CasE
LIDARGTDIRSLAAAFDPRQRGTRDVLYRLEPESNGGQVKLLVQSETEPDWARALARFFGDATQVDTQVFEPEFRGGECLRFRLRANPTRKVSVPDEREPGKMHKTRLGIIGVDEAGKDLQQKWLARKLAAAGAGLHGCIVIPEGMVKARQGERTVSLLAVRFEGTLGVVRPETSQGAIRCGIGSAKGFGFGLLSLASVR